MTRTPTTKTLGCVLTLALLATGMMTLAPVQGEKDTNGTHDPDWFLDRAVIGFRDAVPDDITDWIERQGGEVLLVNHRIHFVLAEFPDMDRTRFAMDRLAERGDVRYVEHDAVVHLDEPVSVVPVAEPGPLDGYTPNNPLWPDQWGPQAIDAPGAWDLTLGSHNVSIGIADTGITGDHPNLVDNICGPHIAGSVDPLSSAGHGTHVAGIAAGVIDGGVGVAGMSQSCLMAIRVLGGGSAGLADGITFAADNGADVINMSFRTGVSSAFRDALDYAYIQRDVVLVKSAGNGGCPGGVGPANAAAYTGAHTMTWPGPEPSVIATAALAPPGNAPAYFSSCGNQMEIAAPGQSIIAPYYDGYAYLSGTSMAAPHVTGLVGLMRAANPELTALEVRCLLGQSADDLGTPGWDPFHGWGRINAKNAVEAALAWDGGTLRQSSALAGPCVLPVAA